MNWYKIDEQFSNGNKSGLTNNTEQVTNKLLAAPETIYLSKPSDASYSGFRSRLDNEAILAHNAGRLLYEVTFVNEGGLVSPLIIEWTYVDGSTERETLPAEIWRLNEKVVTKVFAKRKQVVQVQIDPDELTGDAYLFNNSFPRQSRATRFERYKSND